MSKTIGHSARHGGLRGHSIGDIYPYMVVAKGDPETSLEWFVRAPDGTLSEPCDSAQAAHDKAAAAKALEFMYAYGNTL